ncbi:MAG: hypothetical protein WA123_12610 [Methylotenera sp.]
MEDKNASEFIAKFAKAEISLHPDLGFIRLSLHHWKVDDNKNAQILPGLSHSLKVHDLEDLIAHLQHALSEYNNSKEQYSFQGQKH